MSVPVPWVRLCHTSFTPIYITTMSGAWLITSFSMRSYKSYILLPPMPAPINSQFSMPSFCSIFFIMEMYPFGSSPACVIESPKKSIFLRLFFLKEDKTMIKPKKTKNRMSLSFIKRNNFQPYNRPLFTLVKPAFRDILSTPIRQTTYLPRQTICG